ncbi:hypothetical protein OGATHE_005400 [Ogataea polymorpha]|uniref:Uncharacterized protein n=1 Tax=Ogataea polymorpha TaxID=460523 RepID=A0A9P8NWU7_9ASCO|nr:hypothetical protein OGATHE_005400 [Ogataea polymorpha]
MLSVVLLLSFRILSKSAAESSNLPTGQDFETNIAFCSVRCASPNLDSSGTYWHKIYTRSDAGILGSPIAWFFNFDNSTNRDAGVSFLMRKKGFDFDLWYEMNALSFSNAAWFVVDASVCFCLYSASACFRILSKSGNKDADVTLLVGFREGFVTFETLQLCSLKSNLWSMQNDVEQCGQVNGRKSTLWQTEHSRPMSSSDSSLAAVVIDCWQR